MRIVTRIAASQVAPQRWRNGGGWTRELLTWPAAPGPWQLRISLATVNAPGPFSVFAGVRRILALVSGPGLLLTVDGHRHRLTPETDPLHFDGAAAVHAEPLGAGSTDLNLMSASGLGTMLRASHGLPWTSPSAQRGLYSSGAGTLHAPASAPLEVAPDSLIWLTDAAGLSLHFAGATAAPAWWLGYAPAA